MAFKKPERVIFSSNNPCDVKRVNESNVSSMQPETSPMLVSKSSVQPPIIATLRRKDS